MIPTPLQDNPCRPCAKRQPLRMQPVARARKPFRFRPPCVGSPAVAKGSAPGRNGTDGGEPREGEGETGAWKVKLYVFVNV